MNDVKGHFDYCDFKWIIRVMGIAITERNNSEILTLYPFDLSLAM